MHNNIRMYNMNFEMILLLNIIKHLYSVIIKHLYSVMDEAEIKALKYYVTQRVRVQR